MAISQSTWFRVIDDGSCSDVAGTAAIFTVLSEYFQHIFLLTGMLTQTSMLDNQYGILGLYSAGGPLRWFRDEILREKGRDDSYDK